MLSENAPDTWGPESSTAPHVTPVFSRSQSGIHRKPSFHGGLGNADGGAFGRSPGQRGKSPLTSTEPERVGRLVVLASEGWAWLWLGGSQITLVRVGPVPPGREI